MPTPGHLLSLLLVWIPFTCSCFALSAASVEPFPSSQSSVVKQAAAAITRAYQDGKINKQTVRLPLSDAMYSDKEEGFVATRAIGWQGGPQETIRFLAPISSSVLRGIKTTGDENTGGLVARVSEQILLDYDGSVLQTAEHPAGAIYDIQALLQANTDNYYLDTIQKIEEQFSDTPGKKAKRLFLLVNPAWRDRSSWGFFGGQRAQELIFGWQGGPQETIRFLAPISSSVLRGIKTTGDENTGGLVARVSEQILLDYDGSVLQTAEHPAGAIYDIQALLQANTDNYYLDTIQKIEEQFSDTPGKKAKRLFLLVNPAWRDRSSWGFFGGQRAQELILDRYETTYAVDEFIVANERVGLLRCWPDDWAVYIATKEKKDDPTNMEVMSSLLATFEERPEYKQIEKALKMYRRKDL